MLPCLKTRPIPWANTELTTDPVFSIDSEAIPRSGVHFPAQGGTKKEQSTGLNWEAQTSRRREGRWR